MLKNPRKPVAVEANPDRVLDSRDHRNGCVFSVLNRTVASGSDEATFYQDGRECLGSRVQVNRHVSNGSHDQYSLPHRGLEFDRCTLMCDIEGGEMDRVKPDSDVLKKHVEMISVEIHG